MPDDTEKAKAGKKLPGQSDDARNKFYDDNPDVPEVEATASSASRDRRIVTWAPEEPEKEERQIQIWDGRLKPPPAPKEVVVTGKKKKAGPAGFASGAAVSMTELPQFTNTKKQAIKHFAAAEEKTPVKDLGPEYKAQPYWKDSKTAPSDVVAPTLTGMEGKTVKVYNRLRTLNMRGCLAMLCYLGALGFYIWVRTTKTLDLAQYTFYGVVVFIVEMIGATTVVLYGINLIWEPAIEVEDLDAEEELDDHGFQKAGKKPLRHNYHVRVLVPCYKEDLNILKRTCACALAAYLPPGCSRTVYLCDDGKDPMKRKWCDEMGPELVYVSGRRRPPGEMNGKSGNLNNVASQLYPDGCVVPTNELLCIFDADQVPGRDFFVKTIWLFDGGENVGMVLSPQAFHNLNPYADLFNHSNIHFWEYMQPGYDALGFISCTGTNFLIRSQAFMEAGGSPTYTLTEDYALGMELCKLKWHCRYVQAYLALGEAPEQIRNCYQQRSRWCKGHFQIIFNREHCPLLQKDLSWFMRLYYASGVWSYVVGAISTPLFIMLPIITIWGGVFPIVVSWWAALGLTVYYVATNMVLYYVRRVQHVQALWFANVSNTLLWWTYVKACSRAVSSLVGLSSITFKTTLKGRAAAMAGAVRDLWMPSLVAIALGASIIAGMVKLFNGSFISTPLAISVLWAIYNIIPPLLVLLYTPLKGTNYLQIVSSLLLLLSFFAGVTAVALMWRTSPAEYNHRQYLSDALYFFRTQRLGYLPSGSDVAWRSDALTYELGPGSVDLTGGWLTGGTAGLLKMTMPTAFTTATLAWGLLTFPQGYRDAGATAAARAELTWGAKYLLKAVGGVNAPYLVSQVGNYTIDTVTWGRPEDVTAARTYYANQAQSADLAGTVAAALAAASSALNSSDAAFATQLLTAATNVYPYARAAGGLYAAASNVTCGNAVLSTSDAAAAAAANTTSVTGDTVQSAGIGKGVLIASAVCDGANPGLYKPVSQYDPIAWGAAWMYWATGDIAYYNDVSRFLTLYGAAADTIGTSALTPVFDPTHYNFGTHVLLAQYFNGPGKSNTQSSFVIQTKNYLYQWICAQQSSGQIQYTPAGRAYSLQSPFFGATANAVYLSLAFSDVIRRFDGNLADIYLCWARQQARYFMGQTERSFIVGTGTRPPKYIYEEASSCPPGAPYCDATNGLLNSKPNPWIVRGALVRGPVTEDTLTDARLSFQTIVQVELNAGWQALLAGMVQAPGQFEQCLQNYDIFAANYTACTKLSRADHG